MSFLGWEEDTASFGFSGSYLLLETDRENQTCSYIPFTADNDGVIEMATENGHPRLYNTAVNIVYATGTTEAYS